MGPPTRPQGKAASLVFHADHRGADVSFSKRHAVRRMSDPILFQAVAHQIGGGIFIAALINQAQGEKVQTLVIVDPQNDVSLIVVFPTVITFIAFHDVFPL